MPLTLRATKAVDQALYDPLNMNSPSSSFHLRVTDFPTRPRPVYLALAEMMPFATVPEKSSMVKVHIFGFFTSCAWPVSALKTAVLGREPE
jgi:hypothetical protein